MGGHSAKTRLERLDEVQGLFRSRDHLTLAGIAEELGISRRTLARDIALLRGRGLPIEGERGRGGGLRLDRNWQLGRLNLNFAEAIDLLLSLAIAEQMQSPLLLSSLQPLRRKVAALFPKQDQDKIKNLRRRILVGQPASPQVLGSYGTIGAAVRPALSEAFFRQLCLDVVYVDQSGSRTSRRVEPHYFVLNSPVWYLYVWDHLRQSRRFLRIDRISRATLSQTGFRLGKTEPWTSAIDAPMREL